MRTAAAAHEQGHRGHGPGDLTRQPLAGAAGLRRSAGIVIVGGASMAILFAMLFLRLSMPAVFVGVLLAGVGAWTLLYPEVGLAALVINALVGLTHLRELPRL